MTIHIYHCENDEKTMYIVDRKTKPRIGQVITAYGRKFEVWYIEDQHGRYRARCELVSKGTPK